MSFVEQIGAYIATHRLLECDGGAVLVALSGGVDSVALLRVLMALGYRCEAAHCNFHLRGEESNRDEEFVVQLCQQLGVPLHLKHMDVPGYQAQNKGSVEMACRELRYAWFDELASCHGCQAIAVAHHQDDNIETFFLNALRGSGIAGLAAMRPRNGNVVRPMLGVTREQIEQYLASMGQGYVIDSTNLECDYKRNKIRNVVMPTVEGQFPGAHKTLAATVEHVRDYADLYQDLLDDLACRITTSHDGVLRISIDGLRAVASQRQALLLCDLLKGYNVSYDLCANIAQIISQNKQGGQHFYTSTHTLSLNTQEIVVEQTACNSDEVIKVDFAHLDELKVKLEVSKSCGVPFDPRMCDGRTVIACDESLLDCGNVVLRHWRDGDRMKPFGMAGTKLVSDVFTDAKLSPEARRRVWLLEADGRIVWLLGVRAANAYRVPLQSTQYVLLSYKQQVDEGI